MERVVTGRTRPHRPQGREDSQRRRGSGRRGVSMGVMMVLLSWAGVGLAAPGDLDPTFGTGGIAITFGPSDRVNALIRQPDGTLVVGGVSAGSYLLLGRYLSDGRVDASFGSGGKVTTPGFTLGAAALLQQPDGKLVVAGSSSHNVLVVRYLSDGQLDATLGLGGR